MNHTKYENKIEFEDSGDIVVWLQNNITGIKDKPISVSVYHNGTIKEIDIGKSLTKAEKKKITDKFPELEGKEIE